MERLKGVDPESVAYSCLFQFQHGEIKSYSTFSHFDSSTDSFNSSMERLKGNIQTLKVHVMDVSIPAWRD